MVTTALLTGLAMGDEAGSGPLLVIHAGSIVLIGVGLTTAALVGDGRALVRSAGRLFSLDRRDAAWVRSLLQRSSDRTGEPEWGMFNTGQKLLAWALSLSVVAVILTGVQAWSAGGEGELHGAAVVATFALLGAHLFMAVVNPATRPALAGMVRGRFRRSWAAEHHGAWLRGLTG